MKRTNSGTFGKIISESQEAQICTLHRQGLSQNEIARRIGFSSWTVRQTLKNHGETLRSQADGQRKHSCDHRFFSRAVSDERAAYWLGFMAADGCVVHSKGSYVVKCKLAGKDAGHLHRFVNDLKSTHSVDIRQERTNYKDGFSASIQINSPQLATDLAVLGITPAKTFTLEWPVLPNEMLRHFMRGYFDGDGTWGFTRKGSGPIQPVFQLLGNESFLSGAQSYLMRECGVKQTKIGAQRNIRALVYGGSLQVPRITHLMYHNATVYLPRKLERIRSFLSPETVIFEV